MSTRHQPNPLDQEHIMQTYQIADTAGQHVATVTASSHRRAALAISCHRDETDIHPVIQGDGRSGCIDDAYGVHLMVEGRELVVTDTELATDTRPEPELVEGPEDEPFDVHGPLAATLSERTLDKVLSRPAHVPSLVMLDRDASAQHLADAASNVLLGAAGAIDELKSALADYRESTR